MTELRIEYADGEDLPFLRQHYDRAAPDLLERKIAAREIIVARLDSGIAGWMTYTWLFDCLPFINELFILEEYRRNGIGSKMVEFFEEEMTAAGQRVIMTSSLANEEGQHFWRKMGYRDAGGVLLADEPLEVFFRKDLGERR
jgi:GNAT superfamily N-acetyltransferase